MTALRLLTLAAATATATACVTPTPAGCRARAEQEYRRCVNPTFRPSNGPVEQTRSDEAQACQAAYQQALTRCDAPPEAPVPAVGTSSTSTSSSAAE